eukprot:gene8501-30817_t
MLLSLKKKKQTRTGGAGGAAGARRVDPGLLRVTKDHQELDLPDGCSLHFDNGPDDLCHFRLELIPSEGLYAKGRFEFTFEISPAYPHTVPKVHCKTKVYHPNIDQQGHICLNILREDWRPVLNLQSIIVGLMFLFLEPNMDDPLHKEAAEVMRADRRQFERHVASAMQGGRVAGFTYDHCLV